jgi:hypothetical protein
MTLDQLTARHASLLANLASVEASVMATSTEISSRTSLLAVKEEWATKIASLLEGSPDPFIVSNAVAIGQCLVSEGYTDAEVLKELEVRTARDLFTEKLAFSMSLAATQRVVSTLRGNFSS